MKESGLQKKIINYITELPRSWVIKTTGGTPGIPTGTPDIIACINGYFVGIEVKHPNGKGHRQPEQYHQSIKIMQAGGHAFFTDNFEECKKMIDEFT